MSSGSLPGYARPGYGKAQRRTDDPAIDYVEPVYIGHRYLYSVVVRVAGSAADRHTLLVFKTRYDRTSRVLEMTECNLVHARQLPSGGMTALSKLVREFMDAAKKQTPEFPAELAVDVTRSPLAWEGLYGDPMQYMLATTGLDRYAAPYRVLGRLLLLSNLQTHLRNGKLVIGLPSVGKDATMITQSRLEQALSNVEAKTPKAEVDELMLDNTGPDDDLALSVGLGTFLAGERLVSAEDLRFVKERQHTQHRWVY